MSLERFRKLVEQRGLRAQRLEGPKARIDSAAGAARLAIARIEKCLLQVEQHADRYEVYQLPSITEYSVTDESDAIKGSFAQGIQVPLPRTRSSALRLISDWLRRGWHVRIDAEELPVSHDKAVQALKAWLGRIPPQPVAEVIESIERLPKGIQNTIRQLAESLGWLSETPAETQDSAAETPAE